MSHDLAVLTGDLIASSELSNTQLDRAMRSLRVAAEQVSDWPVIRRDTRFTRIRGDGWQIIIRPHPFALRGALFLRARLRQHGKAFATRISIATGAAELPASGRDLNHASGPAFVASGHGLDAMARSVEMNHADGGAIAAATRLADHVSQGWTPAQARVVAEMLPPFETTQAEVAKRLGHSQQAVQQALLAAGFPATNDALELIEQERRAG